MANLDELKQISDSYETTFLKEIEVELADYISVEFLKEIAQAIERRVVAVNTPVQVAIQTEMGASFETSSWDAVIKILEEAKKYNRVLGVITLGTGIFRKSAKSGTHYSVDFRIQRLSDKHRGSLSVYAVAGSVKDSQHIIDWSLGLIEDFAALRIDQNEVEIGSLVISAKDGMVTQWSKSEAIEYVNEPQQVVVVNPITVKPTKWSDRTNVIAIAGIIITAILVIIGWIYFSGKNS